MSDVVFVGDGIEPDEAISRFFGKLKKQRPVTHDQRLSLRAVLIAILMIGLPLLWLNKVVGGLFGNASDAGLISSADVPTATARPSERYSFPGIEVEATAPASIETSSDEDAGGAGGSPLGGAPPESSQDLSSGSVPSSEARFRFSSSGFFDFLTTPSLVLPWIIAAVVGGLGLLSLGYGVLRLDIGHISGGDDG